MNPIEYAKSFLGVPYKYGGNTPHGGLDCSALCCEILKAFGVLHHKDDFTASGLALRLLKDSESTIPHIMPGQMLFYSDGKNIKHCSMAITDKLMIESGGGASNVVSTDIADNIGAFVRIRPIRTMGLVHAIMPKYLL